MRLLSTFSRRLPRLAVAMTVLALGSAARGQVVINEIVEDEQDFDSTNDISPDTREFVELYNAGNSPIDISGWTLSVVDLGTGTPLTNDAMPSGATIPAKGYYVIGNASVPNVNFTPVPGELWGNSTTVGSVWELRNPNQVGPTTLVDAMGMDTFRGVELANATQEQLDQIAAGQTAGPAATGGWWGQIESVNANAPNLSLSIARYLDGRDTNSSGRDYGMLRLTPGASNNLPQNAVHTVPDVTGAAVNSVVSSNYFASFKLPVVINPTVSSLYNPTAIPASPQGGNAIIAWDETGGGNAVYSKEYVNKFEISAFIDPRPFNNTTATTTQSEATIYGIGTTDVFFGTPNSADLLTGQPGTGGNITSSANGSTGLGWMIQRRTSNTAGVQDSKAVLQLLDMNDGGDGFKADNDWQIKAEIDLTGTAEGWHTLSIDYNPTTGAVTAKYDAQTTMFTTTTGLVGNFYVGYREQLPGTGGTIARPPTFDLVVPTVVDDANFDNDGDVDGADFLAWQRGFGGAGNNGAGDANGDGQVTGADFQIWKNQFGTTGLATAAGSPVPEPAAGALAALAVAACGFRLRGRRA